jgi:hypothetical protein
MEAVRFSPFAVLIALPLAPRAAKVGTGETGAAGAGAERAQTSVDDGTP